MILSGLVGKLYKKYDYIQKNLLYTDKWIVSYIGNQIVSTVKV